MRIIKEADPIIARICGTQKKNDEEYRWIKHMLSVSCPEGMLLYNTFTGELLLMEMNDSQATSREELIQKRFLVPKSFQENSYENEIRRIAALMIRNNGKKTGFTILTTTDCNARCYYCYEKGIPRFTMSEQTAADVGDYIAHACGGDEVSLHWFGGEPLLNARAIDTISGRLREQGVRFHARMTSNGYLLEPDIIQRAVSDWHLKSIQITIDGTSETYKRTKAYVNTVDNPLARLLEQIDQALNAGIEIIVRLNVDADNADDLLQLCDILKNRFGVKPNLRTIVVLLRSFGGKICSFENEEYAAEKYFQITEKLESLGLLIPQDLEHQLYGNRCMADSDSSEVILPDGRIAKCEHFDENEVVGSIYDPTRNEEILRSWREYGEDYEECKTCEFYPRCNRLAKCPWHMGGCELSKRLIAKRRLERQILRAYEESKKGKE